MKPGIIACSLSLCAVVIATVPVYCSAEEKNGFLDVQAPQKEPSLNLLPERREDSPGFVSERGGHKNIFEREWYWRTLEGVVLGIAVFRAEKEREPGRPPSASLGR